MYYREYSLDKYEDGGDLKYKHPTIISLEGNRKLINKLKTNDFDLFNPKGSWNGYGYEKLPLAVRIFSDSDLIKFNKIKDEIEIQPVKKQKSDEEIKLEWAKRLTKLTKIPLAESIEIAEDKLDYQLEQVNKMINLQFEKYSHRRQTLINEMQRENPLRRIKDKEHALAILSAQKRHTQTNYEKLLDEGRNMAKMGMLDRENVKDFARQNMY